MVKQPAEDELIVVEKELNSTGEEVLKYHIYKHVHPLQERVLRIETTLEYQQNNITEIKHSIDTLEDKLTKRVSDTADTMSKLIVDSQLKTAEMFNDHVEDEIKRYDTITEKLVMALNELARIKFVFLGVTITVSALWTIIELATKLGVFK